MSAPILFTNYFLRDSVHFQYMNHLLAKPQGKTLLWDNMTREVNRMAAYQNSESYFRLLLSNSPLSKAFYFTFGVGFLFLLLSIKRKQRPIPVMDQNQNTSLEFSRSVARLHYMNPNHKLMLDKRRKHFQSFVSKRYGLVLTSEDESLQRLSEKSGIDFKYIKKLFNSYKLSDTKTLVSESLLMQVANLQEHFYLNCK
jgi:hypothetical protein